MLAAREEVPKEIVKLMLLLKIQSLAMAIQGYSCSKSSSRFFNNDILPLFIHKVH
jgi:hypothetical protein